MLALVPTLRSGSGAAAVVLGALLSELEAIRWGSAKLQGARDKMEDDVPHRILGVIGSLHPS
jgi:hypothetical protein